MAFTPVAPGTQIRPLGTATQTSSVSGLLGGNGGGQQGNILNQLLARGVLSGKVSSSDVSALQNLGYIPPQQTATERKDITDEQKSANQALSKLSEIESFIKTNPQSVGYGKKLQAGLFGGISPSTPLFGGLAPNEKTSFAEAIISDYNTRLFEIAGKAFTGPEKEVLRGLVLDIGDSPERIQQKINAAKSVIAPLSGMSNVNQSTFQPTNLNQVIAQPQSMNQITPPSNQQPPMSSSRQTSQPQLLQHQRGDNPLMFGAAKLQELLSGQNKLPIIGGDVLPIAYGSLGRGLSRGSSIGTGVGAGTGEYLKQLLQPGGTIQEQGLKALLPTGKEQGEIVGTGLKYGILDKVFKTIGELLNIRGAGGRIEDLKLSNNPIPKKTLIDQIREKTLQYTTDPRARKVIEEQVAVAKNSINNSGEALAHKQVLTTLSKYGRDASGKEKLISDTYKAIKIAYDDILTGKEGVLPELIRPQQGFALGAGIKNNLGKILGRLGWVGLGAGGSQAARKILK